MDWARAIEINQTALVRIVAMIFAMLGLEDGGKLERPPRGAYLAALRILRPAESAVRRLIIIAARGLVLKPLPPRPMPKGIVRAGKKTADGRISFQLFDPRKRFSFKPRRRFAKFVPRVWTIDDPNLIPSFLRAPPAPPPVPVKPDGDSATLRFGRRLAAIKSALDDLPRQARRLVRWQNRRDKMASPVFTSPMRPGAPPGYRNEPVDDVDFVLKECHWLARNLSLENTS